MHDVNYMRFVMLLRTETVNFLGEDKSGKDVLQVEEGYKVGPFEGLLPCCVYCSYQSLGWLYIIQVRLNNRKPSILASMRDKAIHTQEGYLLCRLRL